MSEWRKCIFSEVIDICPTVSLKGGNSYSFVEMKDLTDGKKYCTPSAERKLSGGSRFLENDTLFARITPCLENGKICQVRGLENGIGFGSTEFLVFRGKKDITDNDYVFYLTRSEEIRSYAEQSFDGSSGRQRVPKSVFDNLIIKLSPPPEQKAIASILSSLDDKIDLLHRQNKTLESMAETLFRQWFIEEDGNIVQLSNVIDFNPPRNLLKGVIAPYLEMANVSTTVFHPDTWYDRKYSSGTKFINGDTLLARITPCLENGKSTYVTFLNDAQVGWGSTEFIVMRSKDNIHSLFTYVLAKNSYFREYAEGCLEGSSGRQRLNIDHLTKFEINIPKDNFIQIFNLVMHAIESKLYQNFFQIRILEKLRNTLLPKLMSSEVRIKA